MISDIYIIHVLCNLISAYIIFKFMNIFLSNGSQNKKLELFSYTVYFILDLECYFFVHIPIIMLIYNILYFLVLTLNYKANFKQRIMAVIYIYSILFIIEMLVAAVSGYIHFPLGSSSKYLSIFGEIANQLIGLVLVYAISTKKQVKGTVNLPIVYWICILVMPVFSLYFLIIIFHIGNLKKSYMILCMMFLMILNFSVIALYNLVVKSMSEHTRGLLLEQQNKYYESHFELMNVSAKVADSLQHDLNGHLISIRSYLKNNQMEDATNYIDKMINIDLENLSNSSKTGNAIIDSILNIKLQEAKNKDIIVVTKIQIPENLNINPFDITVIFGNIIDNAIEAVYKVREKREINILILYNRGRILFKVENTYSGIVTIKRGKLMTNKLDSPSHGIGLENVENAVEKYNGTVDISYNEIWFKVCIMLYI